MMNPRERFYNLLHFKPVDQFPKIEWAPWWDKTYARWLGEGLPAGMDVRQSLAYFGMDDLPCITFSPFVRQRTDGEPAVRCERDYHALKKEAFSDSVIEEQLVQARAIKDAHARGEFPIRIWLDGYFWFPRRLFGIEPHLLAFYDFPDLMLEMNTDLAEFNKRAVEALYTVMTPEMIGFAEDMSYNLGPMLSRDCFEQFIAPFYRDIIPVIKTRDTCVFVDSDGDITSMVPWLLGAGIDGVYPLERQAGVDLVQLRKTYPHLLLMGGYDKMVMSRGEPAMREEFDRLFPVVKSGGYILSVDHQTPPGVSLENYRTYTQLYKALDKRLL